MAIQLDTRIPLQAAANPLDFSGALQKATAFNQQQQLFQQQSRANDIAQRLSELKADFEARKIRRDQAVEQGMADELAGMTAGTPAVPEKTSTQYIFPTPRTVVDQPAIPATPPRQPTASDLRRAQLNALFKAGDMSGLMDALKSMRPEQAQYAGTPVIGRDGQYHVLNQLTGQYEPTGIYQPQKPAPEKEAKAPRYQLLSDESGTYRVNVDNPSDVVPVMNPGGVPITKPQTQPTASEDERKAAGWVAQAQNALGNMRRVMAENPGAEKPGIIESMLPESAANVVRGSGRQQFVQAASSFAEAALRAATGAGVTEYEAKQKIRELTPVVGDSQDVIAQKLASIPVYLDSLKQRAGRALNQQQGQAQKPQQTGQRAPLLNAVGYLKTQNISNQSQFNAAVRSLKAAGWTDDEIRAAAAQAGL